MNNLRTKIEAFIESHPDLVAEYDSMQEYIPIHYSIDDIIECYTKLKKINPDATVPNTLRCALKYANEYGVSIIDAFENLSAQSVIGTGNSENIIPLSISNFFTTNLINRYRFNSLSNIRLS